MQQSETTGKGDSIIQELGKCLLGPAGSLLQQPNTTMLFLMFLSHVPYGHLRQQCGCPV